MKLHDDDKHRWLAPQDVARHLATDHTVDQTAVSPAEVHEFESRVDTDGFTENQIRAMIIHERLHRVAGDE